MSETHDRLHDSGRQVFTFLAARHGPQTQGVLMVMAPDGSMSLLHHGNAVSISGLATLMMPLLLEQCARTTGLTLEPEEGGDAEPRLVP